MKEAQYVYCKFQRLHLRGPCVFCEDKKTIFRVFTGGTFQRWKYNPAKSDLYKSWM